MIARSWRGATRAQDSERYLEYLHRTGIREYRRTEGNRGVLALRRTEGDRSEFLLITLWDSPEAIQRFAGSDIERAVFYPEDEQFLIERDEDVSHYQVVYDSLPVSHA